jgi:cytochrome c oxidase subunit 2
MKSSALLAVAAVVFFVPGCRSDKGTQPGRAPAEGYYGPMMGPMMRGRQAPGSELRFKTNGQRIYYTATSGSAAPLTASGGPHWFEMHGGSCVDCHGPDGTGGYVVPMTDVVAPNITYSDLTSKHHMHGGEEHPPYTDALIKRAITKGLDPAGHSLSYAMPRWNMSEGDLNDLIAYLKTLGKGDKMYTGGIDKGDYKRMKREIPGG